MTAKLLLFLLLTLSLLLFAQSHFIVAEEVADSLIPAKCVKVLDGDTAEISFRGFPVRIRLANIDAPEKKQKFGKESLAFLQNLLLGKEVWVNPNGSSLDKYNRTICELFIEKEGSLLCVNTEMVKKGYAMVYNKYCNKQVFEILKGLEETARLEKKGLWQETNPQTPWDFRAEEAKKTEKEKK